MPCMFCEGGDDYRDAHPRCSAEFERRYQGGICLRCGIREKKKVDWCEECYMLAEPPFQGYPPEGV